jgi:hypothetical protein
MIKKIIYTTTNYKLDQKRDFVKGGDTLTLWWITGITDTERNFSIVLQKPKKCSYAFKITQKGHYMGM